MPDLTRRPAPAVPLEGAHGPLAPAQSRAMLAAIVSAHDQVHLETHSLEDDEVGQRFTQALVETQRAGVQVLLLRASVGTMRTPTAFFDRMADAVRADVGILAVGTRLRPMGLPPEAICRAAPMDHAAAAGHSASGAPASGADN